MSETFFFPNEQRGQILRLINLFTNHPGDEIHWQVQDGEKGLTITVERVPSNVRPVKPGNPEDWREHSRGGWDEHRRFPFVMWTREVVQEKTRLGYIEWVEHKLEEEENEGPGVWLRETFTIDDINSVVGYHLPENTWNGWQMPGFPKDHLINWLKQEYPDDPRIVYNEEKDAIFCPENGNDPDHQWAVGFTVQTEDGPMKLYAPEGWTWDIGQSGDAPCDYCGHTKDAHILGGEGRCGLCNCPKFTVIDNT